MYKAVHLPNLFTISRVMLVPFMLYAAYNRQTSIFFSLFLLAGVSDCLDGYLARKFDLATDFGATLDSVSDTIFWMSMPFCVYWLVPNVMLELVPYLIAAFLAWCGNLVVYYIKFRRFSSLHTFFSKALNGLAIPCALCWVLWTGDAWFAQLCLVVSLFVSLERILITLSLTTPQANVRSLYHIYDNATPELAEYGSVGQSGLRSRKAE